MCFTYFACRLRGRNASLAAHLSSSPPSRFPDRWEPITSHSIPLSFPFPSPFPVPVTPVRILKVQQQTQRNRIHIHVTICMRYNEAIIWVEVAIELLLPMLKMQFFSNLCARLNKTKEANRLCWMGKVFGTNTRIVCGRLRATCFGVWTHKCI